MLPRREKLAVVESGESDDAMERMFGDEKARVRFRRRLLQLSGRRAPDVGPAK